MIAAGYILDESSDWLARAYDRRDDYAPDADDDQGDIRETDRGIESKLHPAALLLSEPKLWGVFSRWCAGQRELTTADYDTLSAWELSAKRAMCSAAGRALHRRAEGGEG